MVSNLEGRAFSDEGKLNCGALKTSKLKLPTCPRRALPGQPQKSFLLEDEAPSDEDAGADGQRQADIEVILAPVLTHSEAGCVAAVCHIYQQTVQVLTQHGAGLSSPDT